MTREQALALVQEKIKNVNLIKHCLATESCMRELAKHFQEDEEKWGLTGLLHDIDYEGTKNESDKHSILGAEMLEKLGLDKEICEAVKTHNEAHGIAPQSLMAKAIFCVDPLTGLIVAATLVMPSKKIADLTTENLINRFGEKSFARGANREIISKCSDIGLSLEEFVKIGLKAMQGISKNLGL